MTEDTSEQSTPETAAPAEAPPYQVLARKYRPGTFAELVGQEAMVRTLTNAIAENRLAHAFILTGVRGVGKTTTARLLARALNCAGAGDKPTMEPCGECEHCVRIAESRHVDVLEMDAASRTGVDDIRDIIDGVRYAPVSARFKVYIVDEVHMLSKNAFNALLKTLEEPPEHVKFIFATTEIRKVPVTVLSRCQRFDLKRVAPETIIENLRMIAERENGDIEDAAFTLIARAAEGSVRDAQSLLDQALAHGGGTVTEAQVRDMLGVVDRALILDLFDGLMQGDVAGALEIVRRQYDGGAEPQAVIQDLLELVHWLTRRRAAGPPPDETALPPELRERGVQMADNLSLPVLSRAWQMLLKGLEEVRMAPSPVAAAEMVLIRIAHSAHMPTPADLARQLSQDGAADARQPTAPATAPEPAPTAQAAGGESSAALVEPAPQPVPRAKQDAAPADPQSFQEVIALAGEKREALLKTHLYDMVHLVRFRPGHIEIRPEREAPGDLATTLARKLKEWTGRQWTVGVSQEAGTPTQREQDLALATADPLVAQVLEAFPGAEITAVHAPPESPAQTDTETPQIGKERR